MALNIFGNTFEINEKVLKAAAKETFLFLDSDFEANLRFVSKARIKELNRAYRNKNIETNVLSFKIDEENCGGDVVICYKEIAKQAKAWDMNLSDAAALLLIHGILHLSGFEHINLGDRAKMESIEAMILKKIGVSIER